MTYRKKYSSSSSDFLGRRFLFVDKYQDKYQCPRGSVDFARN